MKTAAAAYYWMSELYYRAPFCPECDRYLAGNGDSLIDYGIFYYEDIYPDSHLYMDAEFLRKTYHPDFLLIHPMNIDDSGHRFGGDSPEYLRAGLRSFEQIARLLPDGCRRDTRWLLLRITGCRRADTMAETVSRSG